MSGGDTLQRELFELSRLRATFAQAKRDRRVVSAVNLELASLVVIDFRPFQESSESDVPKVAPAIALQRIRVLRFAAGRSEADPPPTPGDLQSEIEKIRSCFATIRKGRKEVKKRREKLLEPPSA